ncbi:MAG: 30S ribosomal protein S5, partial [Nanoarchaeota archaeon]|nr:30S ribosomal protein S5 [Nanoarchaeota archaeon]
MKPKKEKTEKVEKEQVTEEHEEEKEVFEASEVVDVISEEEIKAVSEDKDVEKIKISSTFNAETWKPKTKTGMRVKNKEIVNIDQLLDEGKTILEAEIVDALIPNLTNDLLLIGQAKGKFGGGQRRIFRQTQKKTREGNKPKFTTYAIVGDQDGHIGSGRGKSKETVPAREKAIRNAKRNIIKIRRGCGSWQCNCKTPHSIPFAVEGKCGSVKLRILPAPKGTGLIVQKECAKMLKLAGIKDAWSEVEGQTGSAINLMDACFTALKQ